MSRDADLQANCDHVDKIERAVSRLMFALKSVGFEWKLGKSTSRNEYDIVYTCWNNGFRMEGEATLAYPNMEYLVEDAILMFRTAWIRGARFIVWRIAPKITSDDARSKWKLYFRWHFLDYIPKDYVKGTKMDDDLPSDVEGFPMPADLVADKRVRDQANMEKQKHLQAEMQARESAMAAQQFVNQGILTGGLYGGVTDAALRAQCLQSAMQFCGSPGDTQKLITMAAAFYKFIKDGPTNLTAVK